MTTLSNLIKRSVKFPANQGRGFGLWRLKPLTDRLLDQLLPAECLFCGQVGQIICTNCQKGLPRRWRCQPHPERPSFSVYYLDFYGESQLTTVIRGLKFGGLTDLAAKVINRACGYPLRADRQSADRDSVVLVPVPISRPHFARRGFNQAQVIATALGERWRVEVADCLREGWRRQESHRLDREERLIQERPLKLMAQPTKKIILVDDVLTTGATLDRCADFLRQQDATVIGAVVLTVTPKKGTTLGRGR